MGEQINVFVIVALHDARPFNLEFQDLEDNFVS